MIGGQLQYIVKKCKKDKTNILAYNNEYKVHYECQCGHSDKIDFRKKRHSKSKVESRLANETVL